MDRKILILLIIIGFLVGVLTISKPKPVTAPSEIEKENTAKENLNFKPLDFDLKVSDGYQIGIFANNLEGARNLVFSPGETLLVSQTSVGKISVVKNNKTILNGLNRPSGITFYNNKLYVAEETKITRYFWDENLLEAKIDKILFDLPKGGRHFTRDLVFDQNGKLYISVGSTCDVCTEKDPRLASVLISDSEGIKPQIFASGLRNSVFIKINPQTGQLWGTEMGRDNLGDNIPPDEINIIKEGKDYGWPKCWGSNCQTSQSPEYELCAHCSPLGLEFQGSELLVALHGSWNSSQPVGYKIIKIDLLDGKENDFITGFLQDGKVYGRPVGLIFDKLGNLFISDDKNGVIYLVYDQR